MVGRITVPRVLQSADRYYLRPFGRRKHHNKNVIDSVFCNKFQIFLHGKRFALPEIYLSIY